MQPHFVLHVIGGELSGFDLVTSWLCSPGMTSTASIPATMAVSGTLSATPVATAASTLGTLCRPSSGVMICSLLVWLACAQGEAASSVIQDAIRTVNVYKLSRQQGADVMVEE